MKITVEIDGQSFDVEVGDLYQRPVIATVDGTQFEIWPEGEEPFKVKQPAKKESVALTNQEKPYQRHDSNTVAAPIPGLIVSVHVKAGDEIAMGQDICVLEAMKMKNIIRSPRSGRISDVKIVPNQQVFGGEVFVEFENE